MTEEEHELLTSVGHWIPRIETATHQFDQSNTLDIRLPIEAATQLRNLFEAIAACEAVIQTFAGRVDASRAVLQMVTGHLRVIHQRLDDEILPAAIAG